MGISSDAMLFYGFSFDDEDSDSYEWEERFLEKVGVSQAEGEGYAEWRNRLQQATGGVEVGHHCSDGYAIPYLQTVQFHASRGEAKSIDPHALTVDHDWEVAIKRFCEVLGLEFKPCGWHLASYMG